MFGESDLLLSIHLALLFGFAAVTSLLMIVTIANRLRLRRVLTGWPAGRLFGFPVWPSVFLVLVLGLLAYSILSGHGVAPAIFAGYLVGGAFWFVSAYFSSFIIISDYGIILNSNQAGRAIAWGQIIDYFEFTRGKKRGYVFFFSDGECGRKRLELTVPDVRRREVREIVAAKLDARFEFDLQRTYGKKALEG
jgi:hypothetical protein